MFNVLLFVLTASRLGRRPKRLKDSSGEQKRETNVPIAPYPTSAAELYKLRMAELQRLLQQNGTFKSELMQAFLQAAQHSFREHQRNINTNDNQKNKKNTSRQNGSETTGYTPSTMSSPTLNTQSHSPGDQTAATRNRNQPIDTGIIEDSLDNFKLDPDNNAVPDSSPTSTTTTSTPADYGLFQTQIKQEPEIDNSSQFSMPDNMMSPFSMSNAAFSQLSPDTMMLMPDMMEMMQGMDPNMMMSGMPAMSPPGKWIFLFRSQILNWKNLFILDTHLL